MYRYCVDNAVTYTSEDFVLFRESPFACWMERLTLENPDHGIPPDMGSAPPANGMERQDDLGETLRAEGKDVHIVDWDAAEPERRRDTLEAMRRGVDFIVNGQLALGPLSDSINLLMRTSGYSQLGSYLYIPCDTQAKTTLHSAFRLCFLADLLHSLQGQLPPQMLIIRGGSKLVPLRTEDHIYHYRAVKQRFMDAMRTFRKHRMPDPVESAHFGRWSDCAHEVLKQRALRDADAPALADESEVADEPLPQVAVAASPAPDALASDPTALDSADPGTRQPRWMGARGIPASGTLAEQAKMLRADAASGPLPSRAGGLSDAALQNLEFIGKGPVAAPPPGSPEPAPVSVDVTLDSDEATYVPPPVLNTDSVEYEVDCVDDSDYTLPPEPIPDSVPRATEEPETEERLPAEDAVPPFSSRLYTSGQEPD